MTLQPPVADTKSNDRGSGGITDCRKRCEVRVLCYHYAVLLPRLMEYYAIARAAKSQVSYVTRVATRRRYSVCHLPGQCFVNKESHSLRAGN